MKKEIQAIELEQSVIKMISKDWFLVSAGDESLFNTMTASWGGIGFLWNKPVAFVFVRPERYTCQFIDQHQSLTLSFFGGEQRKALTYLGTTSGRDEDKVAQSGLTPYTTPLGNRAFEEATVVMEGKTLFKMPMQEAAFLDTQLLPLWYGKKGNLHNIYVVELSHIWIEE